MTRANERRGRGPAAVLSSVGGSRGSRERLAALLLATTLLGGLALPASAGTGHAAADAQLAQSAATYRFSVPPQSLTGALVAFSDTTGIQFFFDAAIARGLESPGASGAISAEAALARLLAGTGLRYRFTNPTTVTLERIEGLGDGRIDLAPITVEGETAAETAWGSVEGYVATRSATATKTDTPLIETPQSISVITSDRMESQGVETLADALRYTPGVTAEGFGLDLRGYGLQYRGFFDTVDASFYRDGQQLKGTAFASFHQLDPYGAERLEVMRGPTSVLYGQNLPGGIVNYVSKRPTGQAFGEIAAGFGNRDRYEGKVDLGGSLDEAGTLSYRLTGLARTSDTQVDYVGNDRMFLAPAVSWQPNEKTSLTFLSHFQHDESGWSEQFLPAAGTVLDNPNGSIGSNRFTGEPDFDEYDLTQYSVGYAFEHRPDDFWTLRQNARYAALHNEQRGVFGFGLAADQRTFNRYGDSGESDLRSFTVDNQVQADFTTGALGHTTLFGVDYQHHTYSDIGRSYDVGTIDIFDPVYGGPVVDTGIYTDTYSEQQQIGVYFQEQAEWRGWNLVLGGRYDTAETDTHDDTFGTRSSQTDSALTVRGGLVYRFDSGIAPYVSYSESFLPVLGTNAAGEPFDPETGTQYEAGVKVQPTGWNSFLTLAAFELTRQNVTTNDPSDPLNQLQTGEQRSRGLEIEALASLAEGLDLSLAYTLLDTEITQSNDGNEGNTPYGVPTHRASLWADYTLQDGTLAGLGLGAGLRYIGETFGDDANTFEVPSVTLVDGSLHYDYGDFSFAINGSNLFDKEYIATCFTAEFGCNYGEGRTVVGSVTYRW